MSQQPPEHIEREMFEIRTRLDPDMNDLRQHLKPKVIADQAKKTARERVKILLNRLKGRIEHQHREIQDSARFQYSLARKAGRDRDPAPFTDAVRNDPRPAVILAAGIVVLATLTRRILS